MHSVPRYICIHGHFYQPPRENPWLESIEPQESALPFHDWNQLIDYECYAPNIHARILDEQGRLRDVLNNYEHISFDFGATLLSWLEAHSPAAYESIVRADATAAAQRSGHGNAVALAYNHMIMPLASSRDKLTQIVWGLEDFKKHFRRDPEGMWLPETAVDIETLDLMARYGIRFTILSPRQARRFRAASRDPWTTLNPESIDPSRPYVCTLPGGRSIVVFFYDGPISRAIAYERLLDSGEELRRRLVQAFSSERTWPQLVHIATDGESYGHHHRFGEMALAYTIERLLADPTVRLTNYGEFLEHHPPSAEVEIVENSSWSCAHGIGRWSRDCGCSVGNRPDWNQKWRTPLRESLDLLRDRVDSIFEARTFFSDPWAARDAYVEVILGGHVNQGEFLARHCGRELDRGETESALKLLEMQRNRMLMYTSCGWFFDDISGIESMQVLRYAARVLQLAEPFDGSLRDDFSAGLSGALSNAKPRLRGDELFNERIAPQSADLPHVAAHAAIAAMFQEIPAEFGVYCYDVKLNDVSAYDSGHRRMLIGHIHVETRVTREKKDFAAAVIYQGGVDLRCSVGDFHDTVRLAVLKRDLVESFSDQSSTELVRKMDRHFPGDYFRLRNLFLEQRTEIVERLTRAMYREQARLYETFYRTNKDLAQLIATHQVPLPDTFLAAARFVLSRRLLRELEKISGGAFPDELRSIIEETRFWNIEPDTAQARRLIGHRVMGLLKALEETPGDERLPAEIIRFLDLGPDLDIPLDLGEAQILFLKIVRSPNVRKRGTPPPLFPELAERLSVRLNRS